jgi:hypothetical protein
MTASRNAVSDFIERTERNLKTVDKINENDKNEGVKHATFFEVTQLLNSAVGLLMFPTEAYLNKLPNITIDDFFKQNKIEPNDFKILHGDAKLLSVRDAVKKIRNAVAHYNVEFENSNNQIVGIYAWNFPHQTNEPDVVFYMNINALKGIFKGISKAYKKIIKLDNNGQNDTQGLEKIERILNKKLRFTNPVSL